MYAVSADSKGLDTVVSLLADVALHPRLTGVALWLGGQEELWKGYNLVWGSIVRAGHSCTSHWRVPVLKPLVLYTMLHTFKYLKETLTKGLLKFCSEMFLILCVNMNAIPTEISLAWSPLFFKPCNGRTWILLGGSRREQLLGSWSCSLLSFTAAWPHVSS